MFTNTKLSTKSLKTYFNQVENIYGKLIELSLFGTRKVSYDQLRGYAEELKDVQRRVFDFGTINTGAMYKAGIMTGSVAALELLKKEFQIDLNEDK